MKELDSLELVQVLLLKP